MQNKDQAPINLFLNALEEFTKERKEAEARKSPEQRALEARQAELRTQALKREKINKEHSRCDALFNEWIKRDTWLIYDEAMPLTKGEKPESETILNLRDNKLWDLVQACANHSLKVINFEKKPEQWRVNPYEWVRWLKEKDCKVHQQLANLVYPKTNIPPTIKTAKANNSRELIKAHRLKALRAFSSQVEELSRKANITWDMQAIPVTKKEFLEVFHKLNPAIKKISEDSFDRDIAEIGIKFQRGIKSSKNNKLKLIFKIS